MISYKRCCEVEIDKVYEAFSIGFSDYIIKIQMPKEAFIERFFGPEGNSLDISFIALDNERPIGVVFSGIKLYEGIKTMRCGTMAIDPEYRGKGVSTELMELHRKEAIKQDCRQLFLEVIVGNDRAINFYKKLGYEKIYDLVYLSKDNIKLEEKKLNDNLIIKEINIEELKEYADKTSDIHINWQNDMEYLEKLKEQKHFGAFMSDRMIGAISTNKNTRINFIYVDKGYRGNQVAASLVNHSASELGLKKMSAGFPNNASLIGFLKRMGFKRDAISQYEMYITL